MEIETTSCPISALTHSDKSNNSRPLRSSLTVGGHKLKVGFDGPIWSRVHAREGYEGVIPIRNDMNYGNPSVSKLSLPKIGHSTLPCVSNLALLLLSRLMDSLTGFWMLSMDAKAADAKGREGKSMPSEKNGFIDVI